jgi:hypothetical protein
MKNELEICSCGKIATWLYMPLSDNYPYYCDEHVPRGCSCNNSYLEEEPDIIEHFIDIGQKFRIEDREIQGEHSEYLSHKMVVRLDDDGRELPCCEFMHLEMDAELIAKIK